MYRDKADSPRLTSGSLEFSWSVCSYTEPCFIEKVNYSVVV